METIGGLLIMMQNNRNILVEQITACETSSKYCMTVDSNLYNDWMLVKLLNNVQCFHCDQKVSED